MSGKFGAVRQTAFVVRDIDEAMRHWSFNLGIGPFFVKRMLLFADFHFEGKSRKSPCVSIALANSGDMQIELIQQHDQTPSIYLDSNAQAEARFHHFSSWLTRKNLDLARSKNLSRGGIIAQECTIPASGVRLIYWSQGPTGSGTYFEISDLGEAAHQDRIDGIRRASMDWNSDTGNHVIEVEA